MRQRTLNRASIRNAPDAKCRVRTADRIPVGPQCGPYKALDYLDGSVNDDDHLLFRKLEVIFTNNRIYL